jgi:tRNA pseudouridine55 synthase
VSRKRDNDRPVPVSRLYLLDKPAGISSFAALGALKRVLGTGKVGHAGTLDPFATGLLIAVSGKLTKTAGMLTGMDKEYQAVFRFGQETDTLDTEGSIIAEDTIPEWNGIVKASEKFQGRIIQVPPVFSAVKIDGKRAYASARDGLDVNIPSREVTIHEMTLVSWNPPDLSVQIRCSKGTYIRSLARDLGLASGSRAYCLSLRRTAIGPFSVEEACRPEDIREEDGRNPVAFFKHLGISSIKVNQTAARALRVGMPPKPHP